MSFSMGVSRTSEAAETARQGRHLTPKKSARRVTRGRLALSVVLAVGTAFVVAALLRGATPAATSFPPADRLQYYLDHSEDFDTLFVGTSRVYRGVVPREFDARMAQLGMPTRSLNLGEPGMRGFEIDRLVRFLVKRPTGNLENLFLDLGVRAPREEKQTHRTVEWHTARQTLAAVSMSRALGFEGPERRQALLFHLKQFGMRQSNYGLGPELWQRMRWQPEVAPAWLSEGGYQSLEAEQGQNFKRRNRRFLSRLDRYERTVARYRDRPPAELSPVIEASLARWIDEALLVQGRGVRPVGLVSPGYGRLRDLESGGETGPLLLNFDRPALHPDLFEPQSRFDEVHLTAAAARRYSTLVAETFVAELRRRENS